MSETCSPGIISLVVRADPYKVITEFYMVDVIPPIARYSGDPGVT